jgi:type 1 glutamine amidotransferase
MLAGIEYIATVLCLLAASLSGRGDPTETSPRSAEPALRVLILSGRGAHNWRTSTPFLRRLLTETGRFNVWACETPSGLTSLTLADFDVLVDDGGSPEAGSDGDKAIAAFVASGKGLVLTHGALRSSGYRLDGKHGERSAPPYWPAVASPNTETAAHFFQMKITQTEHPVVQGMRGHRGADAPFHGLTLRPGVEVIAVAHDETPSASPAKDAPLLIASSHGKGRVLCCALGHDLAAMRAAEFIATFARGTEWAATGTVTLPPDLGLAQPHADAVRALLITGGHDHETSFYSLFDGYRDLARMPVMSSSTAFQNDLRGKYDVLVMYDFSRDLSETGKQYLRAFVESGKGIVVLHHALLNYQEWPWWYEEVVGGSYRLRREGLVPSSTVKNDQEIAVTPAGEHPITRALGRFQVHDETYRNMHFSTRIRPLLTTDNPTSDPCLAWIGPCTTSRVVAIQLGHGPTIFRHPSYRTLVHNAILWSAGRLR